MAYLCPLFHTASAFSVKIFKTTSCLGGCSILNALNLEKFWVNFKIVVFYSTFLLFFRYTGHMPLISRIMSTHILLHKHKSKSQKPKQVSNGRLKPLKKQVSKYFLRNWEISQKGLLQISLLSMRLKVTSAMRVKRGTCYQILRFMRKSQCFPNFYMNVTIGSQMVISRYALRYFTRFTLFMVNNAEEFFHVFLDYCLIKPRRLTPGLLENFSFDWKT